MSENRKWGEMLPGRSYDDWMEPGAFDVVEVFCNQCGKTHKIKEHYWDEYICPHCNYEFNYYFHYCGSCETYSGTYAECPEDLGNCLHCGTEYEE